MVTSYNGVSEVDSVPNKTVRKSNIGTEYDYKKLHLLKESNNSVIKKGYEDKPS